LVVKRLIRERKAEKLKTNNDCGKHKLTQTQHTHTRARTHRHAHTHTHTHTHTCTHTHVHALTDTHTCTQLHTHTCTHRLPAKAKAQLISFMAETKQTQAGGKFKSDKEEESEGIITLLVTERVNESGRETTTYTLSFRR
jgi:hypothetical protein